MDLNERMRTGILSNKAENQTAGTKIDDRTIGARIKDKRKELDLSVDEVAEKINKNRATIYRYENDEIENLPITVLEPLAEVLNTTPAYLMGWQEKDADEEKEIKTIAAHHDDEDWTEEELKEIDEFKKFVLSKRKNT